MGQTERKDLLSQFMGLNLFDELCVPATEKLKELETEIKFLQRNESTEDLRDVNTNLDIFTQKFKDLCFQKERLTEEKKSATDLVISLTEKIVKFDEEVSTDISGLRRKKVGLESSISSLGSDLITIESKISELKTELVSAESKMAVLRNSGVEASFELLCSLKNRFHLRNMR
jgi:chromosome segregation ATPase